MIPLDSECLLYRILNRLKDKSQDENASSRLLVGDCCIGGVEDTDDKILRVERSEDNVTTVEIWKNLLDSSHLSNGENTKDSANNQRVLEVTFMHISEMRLILGRKRSGN